MKKNILLLLATIALMSILMSFPASALDIIPPDEVDSFLLDSLNNNYYSLLTIDYRGTQNNALGSLVEYWDTALPSFNEEVDYINRAGGFAIEFLPIQNNFQEPGDLGIPDSFNLSFNAGAVPFTYPCENFHIDKICPVFYTLSNVQTLNATLGTSIYQEKIFILANVTPWSSDMNLSFHIYQFESPEALTFREKVQANVTTNTLRVQEGVVSVVEKFSATVDWSYSIMLTFYWILRIGLIFGAIILIFTIPFKFVDLVRLLKKKYARGN